MKYKMQHIILSIMTLYCIIDGVSSCGKAAPPNFGVPVYKPVEGGYEYENKYKILNREQRDLTKYSQSDFMVKGEADSAAEMDIAGKSEVDSKAILDGNDIYSEWQEAEVQDEEEEGEGRAMLDLIIEAALKTKRNGEGGGVKNLIVTRGRRDIHISEQKNDKAQETADR